MNKHTENSLVIPVLLVLQLRGPTQVKDLAGELEQFVHLHPKDKVTLDNRKTTAFEQTVYNLVSHRKLDKVVKGKKLVAYSKIEGGRSYILSITYDGIKYLKKNFKGK